MNARKLTLNQRILPLFGLMCGFALVLMTPDQRAIAVPALASCLIVLWLGVSLWGRDSAVPLFDVGMICAVATLLYTVIPLLNYWLDGLQFGPLSDSRLQAYRITPQELGLFHLRHLLYLFFFVAVYLRFRRGTQLSPGNVQTPRRFNRHLLVVSLLALTVYFFLLQQMTGFNPTMGYAPEAFAEYVSAVSKLPLLLLQISIKFGGILLIIKLALLVLVVGRFKYPKWRLVLVGWAAFEVIEALNVKGARTGLVLFLFGAILAYHRLIKPLTIKILVPLGTAILVGFLIFGVYRSYYDVTEMQTDFARRGREFYSATNEFQALLGTSFDVYQRKRAGVELPWYLYLNDFMAVLPPRQIVPFEKVAASEWYLREIGLSGTGQGYMWGVISQSVIGLDWLELALRGAILGYLLARLHRWYVIRQKGFLETVFYLFICVKAYYTFRDTTLSLLANIVWEFFPFYLLFLAGKALSPRETDTQRIAAPARS